MPITITKQPAVLYPVFNDAWVIFASDIANESHAEISISGYPSFRLFAIDGQYRFNLKEVAKTLFSGSFKDTQTMPAGWFNHYNNSASMAVTFRVFATNGSSQVDTETFTFYRGAHQIGTPLFPNTRRILAPTTDNGIDYHLSYWQGFPFDFQLLNKNTNLTVKNLNTVTEKAVYTGSVESGACIYIDKAGTNWTSANFIPLPDLINRLEIKEGGTFRTNLNLKKYEKCKGVYLKWFNMEGGYSYHLFNEFREVNISGKSEGTINAHSYLNVSDADYNSPVKSLGYRGEKTLKVRTRADLNERKILESLAVSPSVQLWSANEPYQSGTWIDVEVKAKVEYNTKSDTSEIEAEILLPELVTPKY